MPVDAADLRLGCPNPIRAHTSANGAFTYSYDYASAGPPEQPQINLPVVYAGKRQVVPELLSGCRKAPILCVGINPNLPGWTEGTRNAIHPYFEDFLQYAHYFRYRTCDKLRIPRNDYQDRVGGATDIIPRHHGR